MQIKGNKFGTRRSRASPTVCQIRLPSLSFSKNNKKYLSNSLAKDLAFFGNLENTYLERANIRAQLRFGIGVSHEEKPGERVKKEIKNREGSRCKYKRERKIWQVKNSKFLEMHSFFSLANLLGVGKLQDLVS